MYFINLKLYRINHEAIKRINKDHLNAHSNRFSDCAKNNIAFFKVEKHADSIDGEDEIPACSWGLPAGDRVSFFCRPKCPPSC